jgi:hypothetical protein
MSALRRQPDERLDEREAPSRVVAHLYLDANGSVATEFITERELDNRPSPSPAEIDTLFGSWGRLDAETLLDDIRRTRSEAVPTPSVDEG